MNIKDSINVKKFWIVNVITILILILFFLLIKSEKQELKEFSKESKYSVKNNTVNSKEETYVSDSRANELNILVTGDIMFDRYIRKQINKNITPENFVKNFLQGMREENKKYDYVVANLEGPITENKSKTLNFDGTYGKDLLFTFPTSSVDILNLLNVKVVSLANNHTDNFYHAAYESTKNFLEKGDIKYFGNPYNNNFLDQKEKLSEIICNKGICVGYIGYSEFAVNNSSGIVTREIKRLRELKDDKGKDRVDFILVMPHFGVEYSKISNQNQKKLAREWIDAGTDLVIGSHPHVIQDSEIYKGKNIYYSVGNYIFDQWFSADVRRGLAISIEFIKSEKGEKSILIKGEKEIKISKEAISYAAD